MYSSTPELIIYEAHRVKPYYVAHASQHTGDGRESWEATGVISHLKVYVENGKFTKTIKDPGTVLQNQGNPRTPRTLEPTAAIVSYGWLGAWFCCLYSQGTVLLSVSKSCRIRPMMKPFITSWNMNLHSCGSFKSETQYWVTNIHFTKTFINVNSPKRLK